MNELYLHLHQNYKHLMELNDATRIASLDDNIWINYPKSDEVIQILEQALNRAQKKPRVQGLLLLIGEI